MTFKFLNQNIFYSPGVRTCTRTDCQIDRGRSMSKPEINNCDMVMIIKTTQILSFNILHQIIVSINISITLSEKNTHRTFPFIDE